RAADYVAGISFRNLEVRAASRERDLTHSSYSTGIVEKDSLDPWGETSVKDYDRLHSEFGIDRIEPLIPRFHGKLSLHLRRGIDFGQRDLARILDAVDNNKPFAVMSGIKPTGVFFFFKQKTAYEMIYFQSLSKK